MSQPMWPMHAGDPNSNWAWFQEQKEVHVNLRLRMSGSEMTDWNEPGTAQVCVSASSCRAHQPLCVPVVPAWPILNDDKFRLFSRQG